MITKSENINELAVALSKAQAEFLPAKMNAVNPFLKNHYADLGSVISASKTACAKYGLSVAQPASADEGHVTVTTLLMHESGQWISSDMTLPLTDNKNIAQAAGSIITYLRRYSLSAMLGIYADEDTDGNGAAEKKPTQEYQDKLRTIEANKPVIVPTNGDMTYDEALCELTSDGVPYGELTNAQLTTRSLGIEKGLRKSDITSDKQEELIRKLKAIKVILEADPKEARFVKAGV